MSAYISDQQLKQAKRVLYMSHLAIGDFVYQGVWLKALKRKYPHLTIDIWFDDCRSKPHSWAAGRNKTLSQWISAEGDFTKLYPIVSSLAEREQQIAQAKDLNYDIIVFVGKSRTEQFVKYARQISSTATIVATKSKPLSNPLAKWWHFNKIDDQISYDSIAKSNERITGLYADCFGQALGLTIDDLGGKQQLKIKYDQQYTDEAQQWLTALKENDNKKKMLFINHLSTATKKDYAWSQVVELINRLHQQHKNLVYIVNCPPDKFEQIAQLIGQEPSLANIAVSAYTATTNFYQLPALMALADYVVSVDTATSHLAACLDIPQVTLMANNTKLWQPVGDCLILEGNGKASQIQVSQVVSSVEKLINRK